MDLPRAQKIRLLLGRTDCTPRQAFRLIAGSFLSAYLLWVFFSYLFVPIPPAFEYQIRHWPLDGYFKFMPGHYKTRTYNAAYTINSHGFRGHDFNPEEPRGYRIIVIGESSTAGLESEDGQTWPSRLEQHLLSKGYCVEIINAGIGMATSANYLALLRNELVKYHPNLFLYYAGYNDHNISTMERYPGPAIWPDGHVKFLRHWFLYKRVQLRFFLIRSIGLDLDEWIPWTNARWAADYRHNLEAMLREGRGGAFILVTQYLDYPADVIADVQADRLTEVARKLSPGNPSWPRLFRHVDLLALQRSIVRNFDNAVIIDSYSALAEAKVGGKQLFYDPVHLTPEGNDVLARSIAERLTPYLSDQGSIEAKCDSHRH
ncbi:MAG: SGNH/GDSL hydrolase family protein [Nitrospira sp.]|nr:SGNH/GDSL hydrolase family protein [Nitrospira sp.]